MPPDPRAVLAEAAALHRAGQTEAAIEGFRRAAILQPAFPDAHRMLAMALLQTGQAKEAVQSARAAVKLTPNDPHALLLLGAGLQAAGQAEKALVQFEKASKIAPAFAEAHFQAGNALAALGRFRDAAARFTRVLDLDPRAIEALVNRAFAFERLRLRDEAFADLERLIALQPWNPIHLVNKGNALLEVGERGAALAAAEKALEIAPRNADALRLLGQVRFMDGDLAAAREVLEEAVEVAPGRLDVRLLLVQVLRAVEAFDAAMAQCEAILLRDPRNATALYERGEVKRALGEAAQALADMDAALAISPRLTEAAVARHCLLGDLGRLGEMRPAIDRAVRNDPTHPSALFHRAMDELGQGHWAKGWEGYEMRARIAPPAYLPLPFARWDGRETPSELVVLGEQGLGDAIQFVRLVPLLAERGFPVKLLVRAALVPLFRLLDPRVDVISDQDGLDMSKPGLRWAPLGSLPLLIAPDPALWPPAPYLSADPERARQWRHVRDAGDFVVGITWQGSTRRDLDVGRSAPLAAFAPLAEIRGVKLVAIQRNAGAEQVEQVPFKARLLRLDEDFDADGAFLDSAALLQHLDLVVTTDTSMAHLAGALGRPAMVALRAIPDWRWGRDGEMSLFYPSLTLVRQAKPGDWAGVFGTIAEMVRRRMAARAEASAGAAP